MYAKNLCYIYKGDNINELDVIIRDKSMFSEDIVVENFNTVFENECVIILQRSDYSR